MFMKKIKFAEMFLKSPRAILQLFAEEYTSYVVYVGGLSVKRLSSKIFKKNYY